MTNEAQNAAKKISGLVRDYYEESDANIEVQHIIQSAITSATAKDKAEIKKLIEALKWYADESINQHNYHATMNTDLTAKAREALKGGG